MDSQFDTLVALNEKLFVRDLEVRDIAYNPSNSCNVPPQQALEDYFSDCRQGGEEARRLLNCEADIPYGRREGELVDLYYDPKCLRADAAMFVYVHGGYWHLGRKEDSCNFAVAIARRGHVYAALGHPSPSEETPLTDTSDKGMASAIDSLLQFAEQAGIEHVYLSGHCSGAHLVGMMLSQRLPERVRARLHRIRGLYLFSGLYTLEPLVDLKRLGELIALTLPTARLISPLYRTAALKENLATESSVIIRIIVGDRESQVFREQSLIYYRHLAWRFSKVKNVDIELVTLPDCDHFTYVAAMRPPRAEQWPTTRSYLDMLDENADKVTNKTLSVESLGEAVASARSRHFDV